MWEYIHLINYSKSSKGALNCLSDSRGRDKEGFTALYPTIYLSYFPTKAYIVGTQMNRLNETTLLRTYNIGLVDKIRILEQLKRFLPRSLSRV